MDDISRTQRLVLATRQRTMRAISKSVIDKEPKLQNYRGRFKGTILILWYTQQSSNCSQ